MHHKKVTETTNSWEFWDLKEVKSRISWAEYPNYDNVIPLNTSKYM